MNKQTNPPVKRLSAAERRAALAQEAAAREAEFAKVRSARWLEVWAKALQLTLLVQSEHELRENNSWWFEEFGVTVTLGQERIDCQGLRVTEATLTQDFYERVQDSLQYGFDALATYLAEKEAARQAELRRQELRRQGRAKLSDEEAEALGLPKSLPY